jgi:hypothetical protein
LVRPKIVNVAEGSWTLGPEGSRARMITVTMGKPITKAMTPFLR